MTLEERLNEALNRLANEVDDLIQRTFSGELSATSETGRTLFFSGFFQ